MSLKPSDVYARELFPAGFGLPLWKSQSCSTNRGEPFVGDVGCRKDGEFRPLFNSMQDAHYPVNQGLNVPRDFQLFRPPNLLINTTERITQPMVFSRSIRAGDVQADIAHGVAPDVAPALRFHCESDTGALLMLGSPGVAEDIQSRRRIVNYIVDNVDSWHASAHASHLDLRLEDICFICGTLKTTQWAIAAFQDDSFRNKDGYVSGRVDSFGNLQFSVQVSDQVLPASHCRTGPHRLPDPARSAPASASVPPRPDQCLFVHYYKGKRRLLEEPEMASSGPHRLPFESEARVCADEYDPVNYLLDYILQSSEASIAIASDLDLTWLFRDVEFPDDIPGALMRLSPYIDLDERGVGTISFDCEFIGKRKDRDEHAVDNEFAREEKRMKYHEDMYPSNPSQAYSDWAPAEPSYNDMGDPADYSQAPQVPQQTQYQQSMHYPQGMEYAHAMSYQQQMQHHQIVSRQPTMEYPHGVGHSALYRPACMPQQGKAAAGYYLSPVPADTGTYVPPGMRGMQLASQDFLSPSYGAALPAELSGDEESDLPPDDEDSHGGESNGDDDSADNDDNDGDTDEDGDASSDEDVEMAEPSGKAQGKRPGWGGSTSVHDGSVTALAYSADGKYLASGSEDATIIIWDAPDNALRHRVPQQGDQGHTDTVYALAFSRDNVYLASASYDEEVIIWTVADGREHMRISPGRRGIYSLAYTPDGKYLIGGAGDGTLCLWDARTHEEVGTLNKNATVVTFIVFSSDGELMATGGTEDVCYVWEAAKLPGGEPLSVLKGHRGMVCAAAFSPDGRRIVTASDDSSSRIWKADTGEATVMLHEHEGPVWTVAFSPDGKRVASGSSDSTVKVCDSYTGERVLSLDGDKQEGMVNAVEFSPDGRFIVSAASDNMVRLWRASDGTHEKTYNEHNDNVTLVMFSPDGSTLSSGSHDGNALIRPLGVGR